MKKRTTLIALGIILSSQVLPLVAHADDLATSSFEATSTAVVNENEFEEVIITDELNTDLDHSIFDSDQNEVLQENAEINKSNIDQESDTISTVNLKTFFWGGTEVTYDTSTSSLTIPEGAVLTNPDGEDIF